MCMRFFRFFHNYFTGYLFNFDVRELSKRLRGRKGQVVKADKRKNKMFGYDFGRPFVTQKVCFPSPFERLAFEFEREILKVSDK